MRRSYNFAVAALGMTLVISCGSESLETRGSLAAGSQSNADTCKKSTTLNLADPVNYEGQLKVFIDASCATAGCHTGNNPSKGVQLANYAGLKLNIAKSISEIESNKMPTGGKPKPSAAQVQMLKDWMTTNFTEKPSAQPAATPTPKPGISADKPGDAGSSGGQSAASESSKSGSASKTSKNSADCK